MPFKKGQVPWNKGGTSWSKGKHLLESHRNKIRDAQKGKKRRSGWHHTDATKKKISLSHTGMKKPWAKFPILAGENSHMWKGGTSKSYKRGYNSKKYLEWRKKVFDRDNYTCQMCGAYGGDGVYVTAHHIKSFAHYPKERYNVFNGLTLCEVCHSKTDNYKGRNMRRR